MARDGLWAIIPVAGLGTRLAPLTRAVPKALFPLVGADGSVRPVADWIAREALAGGAEGICFVTSAGQETLLRRYFDGEPELAGRIVYVSGVEPFGFGYAVWSAREVVSGSDVMVLLGDHIHLPAAGAPAPTAQVREVFAGGSVSAVVGVQVVSEQELRLVGVCRGEPLGPSDCAGQTGQDVYRCTDIIEKPDPATAARRLSSPGLPPRRYLAHAGIYLFTEEIFDCLEPLVARRAEGAEVGLTEAQQALLERHPDAYLLVRIAGRTCDVGTPAGYVAAQAQIR